MDGESGAWLGARENGEKKEMEREQRRSGAEGAGRSVRDESRTPGQREARVSGRRLAEGACVGGTGDPAGPRGDPEVWARAIGQT